MQDEVARLEAKEKAYEFLLLVAEGKIDDMLMEASQAILARRILIKEQKGQTNLATLRIDDLVKIVNIRPGYLEGIKCRIVEIKDGLISVSLLESTPRGTHYRIGSKIRVKPTCLEKF